MFKRDLKSLLNGLIATWENEVVELKQARNDYPTSKIGKYFSALANEANLKNMENEGNSAGIPIGTRQPALPQFRAGNILNILVRDMLSR